MARNILNGPLQYSTLREGFVPSVSKVADRTLRVYWADQTLSSKRWEFMGDSSYVAPTGWPVEGEVFRMPKVVNFIYGDHAGPARIRDTTWSGIVQTVKAALEGAHSNFFVRHINTELGGSSPMLAWLRDFFPMDSDVADGFIGADVLNIILHQNWGNSFGYDVYLETVAPGLVAGAAARYAADYDKFAAAHPLFRRNVGWIYQDTDYVEPATAALPVTADGETFPNNYWVGGTGWSGIPIVTGDDIWTDMRSFFLTRMPQYIDGSGPYASGRPLAAFDWEWKGERGHETASAATFISEIEAHFGL